jgi:hypothetical protein
MGTKYWILHLIHDYQNGSSFNFSSLSTFILSKWGHILKISLSHFQNFKRYTSIWSILFNFDEMPLESRNIFILYWVTVMAVKSLEDGFVHVTFDNKLFSCLFGSQWHCPGFWFVTLHQVIHTRQVRMTGVLGVRRIRSLRSHSSVWGKDKLVTISQGGWSQIRLTPYFTNISP